jgi:hypothetical protein
MTTGNVDERHAVKKIVNGLFGKLFDDKGYIRQSSFEKPLAKGINW